MNLKVTKNIQQLVAQRRAKRIETVRNEVITVNLKDARAKLAEATGAKQGDSPTTPTPMEPQDSASVTGVITAIATRIQQQVEKSEATPQAPAPDTASLSPMDEDTPTPVDADVSSWKWVNPACSDCDPVDAGVSSGTGLESVDTADVSVKKPTRSRSRSKSKAKK
jgi:hypothetical protein